MTDTEHNDAIERTHTMQGEISRILQNSAIPEERRNRFAGDIPEKQKVIPDERVELPKESMESTPQRPTVSAMHTLKDDMQDVVRGQKVSMVHAAALEQQKRSATGADRPQVAPKHVPVLVPLLIVCALVVVSVASLIGVAYVEQTRSIPQQQVTSSDQMIVFSEHIAAIKLDGTQPGTVKVALASARESTADAQGSITRVVPQITPDSDQTPRQATLTEFFGALGITPPDQLTRSLSPSFFFGFHTLDKRYPFFVIPVTSYDNAVAGMLAWEPNMNADLSPVFTLIPKSKLNASGIPVSRTFSDTTMHNYDVRVLTNDAGAPVLYYSFPSPSILVIAENPYTFPEVISRLQAQREL